ncbi:MAG: 4-carboxy-2-hydroxymuconate-6-semialdehyde dehydrogenase [bacterium ADurb.Bin243]|nr:MAG: 4-carboxy-2-hydroxymuconate-6-semialdehyde dehydrogenase [bacterium ADurb.Bin243]
MLQAIVKKGRVIAENIPAPMVSDGCVLIKVVNSCISAGTEMSGVNASSQSLIKKALEQPEKVMKAFNMLKNEGLLRTYEKIKGKLDGGNPTGYSIAGVVIAASKGAGDFKPGDRVAAAGAGIANHAEFVDVPVNLVMKVPEGLDLIKASSVTLGGIAMQGLRRAELGLGEFCVVTGAGILGLLTLQMLKISGVRCAVSDIDEARLAIAKELGAELTINPSRDNAVSAVENWTGGRGCDAVIFTAATGSNEPLSQAFKMCKRKGRVILVGVSGMEIKREDIYNKELDFMISTSYGPGRYDANYEQKGLDYPYAYVRWTENRNMTEYLRLLSADAVKLDKIINGIYPIEKVGDAFESLKSGSPRPLMVILDYGRFEEARLHDYLSHERKTVTCVKRPQTGVVNVALIGAGGFATGMHLPNMNKMRDKYRLYAVANRTGHKAQAVALQYGADYSTTNVDEVLADSKVDLVMICTRHDSHAGLALKSLRAGKNVFVEKPLATTDDELKAVCDFYSDASIVNKPLLMTGFNRRFSRYAAEIKKHTDRRIGPLLIRYRMNAGFIPLDNWVHESGGRIVGECCHIIDLMTFFTGAVVESVGCESLSPSEAKFSAADNKSITLKYKDGSVCSIDYFAVGGKSLPKEFMEVHFDEKSIVMEDYKSLKGYGLQLDEIKTPISEKGQFEELEALYRTLRGEGTRWPIELWDMAQTTKISFL